LLLGVVGLLCLFLALVVPYHATDAFVYGRWSRLIAVDGHWFFDALGSAPYSRPLFYVPQGYLWWAFGVHEWLGRLLQLAFTVVFVWSLARLARDRSLPGATPLIVCLLLLACPEVVRQAMAGQTDMPVAAMLALTAVGLWRMAPSPAGAAVIGLGALAAALGKPTAFPALGGLFLAHLIGSRAQLRERVVWGLVPLVAGTLVALLYDWVTARHFGLPLNSFLGGSGLGSESSGSRLSAGVTGLAESHARLEALPRADWLGPYLRLPLMFTAVYAVGRIAAVPHRIAAIAAWALAFVGYWVAPSLVGGQSPLDTGAVAVLASLGFAALLAATPWCPAQWIPPRLWLGRLALWAGPPLLAWAMYGIVADVRTLSPAWPALFLSLGTVTAMGVVSVRAVVAVRGPLLATAALALLLVAALADLRNLDAIGVRPDGSVSLLRGLADLKPSTWTDPDAARDAADPQLGGLVTGLRSAVAPAGAGATIVTNDGRMPFYFQQPLGYATPLPSCRQLRGADALGLLLNTFGPADYAKLKALDACPGITLQPIASTAGSYAVWRVRSD
jgi:hypothetical protein